MRLRHGAAAAPKPTNRFNNFNGRGRTEEDHDRLERLERAYLAAQLAEDV